MQIVGSKTLKEITAKALKPSDAKGDVTIKVTYEYHGKKLTAVHNITMGKPNKISHTPLKFVNEEVKAGRIVIATVIGAKRFTWTLHDQLGDPIKHVKVSEKVRFDFKKCIPKRFIPIARTGSATTNSAGQFDDVYVVQIVGEAPPETNIIIYQAIICAGYKDTNTITIKISEIKDTAPLYLK